MSFNSKRRISKSLKDVSEVVGLTVTWSCNKDLLPKFIELESARKMAPYQTELLVPRLTEPTMQALGAMKLDCNY